MARIISYCRDNTSMEEGLSVLLFVWKAEALSAVLRNFFFN